MSRLYSILSVGGRPFYPGRRMGKPAPSPAPKRSRLPVGRPGEMRWLFCRYIGPVGVGCIVFGKLHCRTAVCGHRPASGALRWHDGMTRVRRGPVHSVWPCVMLPLIPAPPEVPATSAASSVFLCPPMRSTARKCSGSAPRLVASRPRMPRAPRADYVCGRSNSLSRPQPITKPRQARVLVRVDSLPRTMQQKLGLYLSCLCVLQIELAGCYSVCVRGIGPRCFPSRGRECKRRPGDETTRQDLSGFAPSQVLRPRPRSTAVGRQYIRSACTQYFSELVLHKHNYRHGWHSDHRWSGR